MYPARRARRLPGPARARRRRWRPRCRWHGPTAGGPVRTARCRHRPPVRRGARDARRRCPSAHRPHAANRAGVRNPPLPGPQPRPPADWRAGPAVPPARSAPPAVQAGAGTPRPAVRRRAGWHRRSRRESPGRACRRTPRPGTAHTDRCPAPAPRSRAAAAAGRSAGLRAARAGGRAAPGVRAGGCGRRGTAGSHRRFPRPRACCRKARRGGGTGRPACVAAGPFPRRPRDRHRPRSRPMDARPRSCRAGP